MCSSLACGRLLVGPKVRVLFVLLLSVYEARNNSVFQPCGYVGKTDSALVLKYTYTVVIRTIQKQIKTGRRKVPNPQKDLVDVQQMRYGTTDYIMKLKEILNSCFATHFYKMK